MPRPSTNTMLASIVDHLARWLPEREPDVAPHPWTGADSSWHTSSFELLQGLEVIEHHEPHLVFADTLPAFHTRPRTQA